MVLPMVGWTGPKKVSRASRSTPGQGDAIGGAPERAGAIAARPRSFARKHSFQRPRTQARPNACADKAVEVQMSVTKERKSELVADFGRTGSDTGSPEVQISILTSRIAEMTGHLQLHKKDFASRRGLLGMVSRRRRLLDYVKRTNPQTYLDLLRRLEIRK
jgi:small subunit ribosomal protein S15